MEKCNFTYKFLCLFLGLNFVFFQNILAKTTFKYIVKAGEKSHKFFNTKTADFAVKLKCTDIVTQLSVGFKNLYVFDENNNQVIGEKYNELPDKSKKCKKVILDNANYQNDVEVEITFNNKDVELCENAAITKNVEMLQNPNKGWDYIVKAGKKRTISLILSKQDYKISIFDANSNQPLKDKNTQMNSHDNKLEFNQKSMIVTARSTGVYSFSFDNSNGEKDVKISIISEK